jgi:hypothetical protein
MKKLILLLTISLAGLFLLNSCANPQVKAEKKVSKFIKKSLEKTDSYESISFGTLTIARVSEDPDYILAIDSMHFYRDSIGRSAGQQAAIANAQSLMKKFESMSKGIEQSYKGKAFKIEHKYKINSEEKDKVFYFDEMLNVIE